MESTVKFKCVYFDLVQRNISIADVRLMRKDTPEAFFSTYKRHFFCPYCHQARLEYVERGQTVFFRTAKYQRHTKGCSLSQNPTSVDFKKNALPIANTSVTQNLLEHILFDIFLSPEHQLPPEISFQSNQTFPRSLPHPRISHRQKYIPRRRIDNGLIDSDFEQEKIFYGVFDLKWEWVTNENDRANNHRKLLFYTCGSSILLGRLRIPSTVYPHIQMEYNMEHGLRFEKIAVAFVALLNKKVSTSTGRVYFSASLECGENIFMTHFDSAR